MVAKRAMLLCVLVAAPAVSAAAAPIPLEHFFREAPVKSVRISPDGQYISALVRADALPDAVNIIVMPARGGAPRAITGYETEDVYWHAWDGDRIVFQVTRGRDETARRWQDAGTYSIKADGSGARELFAKGGRIGQYGIEITSNLPLLKGTMLANGRGKRMMFPEPYRLDTETGRFQRLAINHSNVTAWIADNHGRLRLAIDAGTDLGDMKSELLYRADDEADWRRVVEFGDGELLVLGFDADDRHVWVSSEIGRDRLALYRLDPETGEFGAPVVEDPRYSVGSELHRANDGRPLYIQYPADLPRTVWLDDDWRALHEELATAIPDRVLDIVSWDDAERRFILYAWSDRDPGTYYLFDREKLTLRELLRLRPWLQADSLPRMHPVRFEARDGLVIEGYITAPTGFERPGPLVMHPHGGPYGIRDVWGFDPDVSALASRGYAVLQVNFRGSGGYGRSFEQAGYRQWGRDMQNDLEDAVAWAVEEGWAEPGRVCIFGASYGGYATLMGVARTPDLFACGISYVGVADLELLYRVSMGSSGVENSWAFGAAGFRDMRGAWLRSRVGDPGEDPRYFRESSPIQHVDRITAPLLLIHGESDLRVPIEHHRRYTAALETAGKSYEEILERYEGHGFASATNREKLAASVIDFLDRHIGPQSAPGADTARAGD